MFTAIEKEQKNSFLEHQRQARAERAQGRHKEQSAVQIQALVRRYLARIHLLKTVRSEIDAVLKIPSDPDADYKPNLVPAVTLFKVVKRFLFIYKQDEDSRRFEYLCKFILAGMATDNAKLMYVSVALSKEHVLPWIAQIKDVLWKACQYFRVLKPELPRDMKMVTTLLHLLIMFTSTTNWAILQGKQGESLKPGMNQLCNNMMGHLNQKGMYPCLQSLLMRGLARSKPCFKQTTLAAILTIALRPLVAAEFSANLLTLYLLHILSVPALIHHINNIAQECLISLMQYRIFTKSLRLLCHQQSTKIIFNVLEGNYVLCLLGNLIQLGNYEMEGLVENTGQFIEVVTKLLDSCKAYVQNKKSNLTHWHPVLGWFSQRTDQSLHEAMPHVVKQLQMLWSIKMIQLLYDPLLAYCELQNSNGSPEAGSSKGAQSKNIIKKAIEKVERSTRSGQTKVRLDSPVVISTCRACGLYLIAINTLTQLKLDILAGLNRHDLLLPKLWRIVTDLGPHCGLKAFLEILAHRPNDTSHPLFGLLMLACDSASHLITILDDVELYEQHKPFQIDDLITTSFFLNQFIFKSIWNGFIDAKGAEQNELLQSVHSLLMILYERDCRRPYAPPDHWLARDVKASAILSELDKNKKSAQFLLQKLPHIIPHKERVILFRKMVSREKEALGLLDTACASPQSTLITVHRSRIVEDGYRQLALLPANALKGLIRVKFVNEQGLDEAGIDQDGVFKEFLEETIKNVFDPSLNLFRVTSEQKLYPSTTSYIQENHLALFEFVGRMLAKAVYEGIVVEVPFAPFFLTQILGHQHSSTYSSIDELPSLDPELYKSLTYVKHYEGDIVELDLTFSYDEDVMGKLITHELIPGGRAIPVTNDNKISYIHLMAHFKMRVQIRDQTVAFIRGFKSLINSEWLTIFATPEVQKLISGDTADIDLEDLRKHTHYYGGFHNNHRVVSWLWDILAKDFTPQERSLFLKFVTSCSKSPLLGFAHLEPPFAIRCVEVSDDQDTGDTVGSMIKGFLYIRKKDPVSRLPTSSTCFNLLKLPNYRKKTTLKEKLRYAISSNTGFELS